MTDLFFILARASGVGLLALILALGAQIALERRVPAAWRVWIWRAALLQCALALAPLTPLPLAVLPSRIETESIDKGKEDPAPKSVASKVDGRTPLVSSETGFVSAAGSKDADISPNMASETLSSRASAPDMAAKFAAPLFVLYVVGIAVHLGILVRSAWRVQRLLKNCPPLRDSALNAQLAEIGQKLRVATAPRLLQSVGEAPLLVGVFRPSIVFPVALMAAERSTQDAVLAHEMAHVKRHDLAWNLFAWFVQTIFWFHPLTWASRRFLPLEIESACDEMVLGSVRITPHSYGALLVDTMSTLYPPLTAGVNDGFAALKTRLLRLNHTPKPPKTMVRFGFACVLTLGLGAALPFRLVARAQDASAAQVQAVVQKVGIVTGRVLTSEGKPVANARVSWIRYDINTYPLTGGVLTSVQTDAEGRFRFENSASLLQQSLKFDGAKQISYNPMLLIESDGWGVAAAPIVESFSYPTVTPRDHEVRLTAPSEVRATFVDGQGQPVPNLRVRIGSISFRASIAGEGTRWYYGISLPSALQRFSAVTDATGKCRISGLPQDTQVSFAVDGERFGPLGKGGTVALSDEAQVEAPTIRLLAAITVQGRITYETTGDPASDVLVRAQGIRFVSGTGEAMTAKDGTYKMKLSPGSYNIALDLKDGLDAEWTARAQENVTVSPGDTLQNLDFKLEHGVLIKGRIVAQDNKEAIAKFPVAIYGPAHPKSSAWVQRTETDENGQYRLRVPAGEQYLYLQSRAPSGYGDPVQPPTASIPTRETETADNRSIYLTVKEGQNPTVDWQFPRAEPVAPLVVQVVDAQGKPVVGAEIEMTPADVPVKPLFIDKNGIRHLPTQHRHIMSGFLYTDAQGFYTFKEETSAVNLRARKGDSATPQAVIGTNGQTVTLRLQPQATAEIAVQVADAEGKPLPRSSVSLTRWSNTIGTGGQGVRVDNQGRHVFSDLWPDVKYTVVATAPGYGSANSEQLNLKMGEARELKPLVLPKAESFVAGRVVDEQGKPISGASVTIQGMGMFINQASTDREGRFRIENVVAGTKVALSARDEQRYGDVRVDAGNSNAEIVLREMPTQGRIIRSLPTGNIVRVEPKTTP